MSWLCRMAPPESVAALMYQSFCLMSRTWGWPTRFAERVEGFKDLTSGSFLRRGRGLTAATRVCENLLVQINKGGATVAIVG
jgi:hypothetical protein